MNRSVRTAPVNARSDWQQLFEAALLEPDPVASAECFQSAKDAIMDRIEDLFDSTSMSERRLLLSALNTIHELERLSKPEQGAAISRQLGHAA